ncbi:MULTISPECIES: polysaccharide deacetylase family protein [Paenibacillus]|uniref:Polysaccharide deacetylase family protein n=1 Tax=Paenibacillus validus TaxID=44253 RepID=A0A7X2Z7U1_9BACL|nr:polysaccharide deacetylase family protein [Paenibacillus validus]MUG69929.1 polysaccharide deacetylase family protein [Paenibacillus validus]
MKTINYVIFGMVLIGMMAATMGLDMEKSSAKAIYYEDKAIVLVYHDVCKNLKSGESNSSTVTSAQFQDHLQMLNNRGFHIISMDDFITFMLHGKSIPPNSVVLTFDDGYTSFYTEAFPILRRFGAPAFNFIVGMTSDLFNPDAEMHLNWEQIREMKAYGMGFYNHTYNLHRTVSADRTGTQKPALTTSMYLEQRQRPETEEEHRKRIFSDLSFLEKRFEQEIGNQHKLLAFPYGAYNDVVLEEGAKAGMELFFTVEEGINEPGSRIVKRINAGEPYVSADHLWNQMKKFF